MGGRVGEVSTMLDVSVPEKLLDDSFGAPRNRLRQFVWAGTLAGHKAGGIALRAFARAFRSDSHPPKFLLFGTGPDRSRLERLARNLGIDGLVEFRGSVPQEDLWTEIRQSLAFIFTSVRDTCGSVSIEALACGTPLVCFKHQGVGEVIDNTCGFAVEPHSYAAAVSDFAAAMRRLADDPALLDRLGEAGRKRVLSHFIWDQKFDLADKIYRKVSQGNGLSAPS